MKTNSSNRKFSSSTSVRKVPFITLVENFSFLYSLIKPKKKKRSFRKGFNLIEVSIALALAGMAMTYTYMVISNGIRQQRMAAVVSNAVHLAKIKMAQIDSVSVLQSDKTTGEIPGYPGYSFETQIGEEDMDLLKLAGKEGQKPEDLLGGRDSEMNKLIMRRSGQANQGASTAGIIRVFRIKVTIKYPTGSGTESYTAETFKSAQY